jgi:hypothetical protein
MSLDRNKLRERAIRPDRTTECERATLDEGNNTDERDIGFDRNIRPERTNLSDRTKAAE